MIQIVYQVLSYILLRLNSRNMFASIGLLKDLLGNDALNSHLLQRGKRGGAEERGGGVNGC